MQGPHLFFCDTELLFGEGALGRRDQSLGFKVYYFLNRQYMYHVHSIK